jgi:hypothetical protein
MADLILPRRPAGETQQGSRSAVAASIPTPSDWHADVEERHWHHRTDYAVHEADPQYRTLSDFAQRSHNHWNQVLYRGQLDPVHFDFTVTPPRSLAVFRPRTGYGAKWNLVIKDEFVLRNPRWVNRGASQEGFERAFDDLILRLVARQAIAERDKLRQVEVHVESTLTEEYNRIGSVHLKLPQIHPRRRGEDRPCAAGWPFCLRRDDYYLDAVTEDFLSLARGGSRQGQHRRVPLHVSRGEWIYLFHLAAAGNCERIRQIAERHMNWIEDRKLMRDAVLRQIELGRVDAVGKTRLPAHAFSETSDWTAWLRWNDGAVGKVALGIAASHDFRCLAILADVLEDAGCTNTVMLRHFRARISHTHRCVALRKLLAATRRIEKEQAGNV